MTRLIDADALHMILVKMKDFGELTAKKAIRAVENAPTADTKPHWIPCSERLPEDDRSKVVTLANGNAEVGYYSNGDWWCVGDKVTLENQTVIAWMPLPKPYEVNHE
jgi:hypothetical protein